MKNVLVITGGGSGMGLEAAKLTPKEKIVIISGRTESKLQSALKELKDLGLEAYAYACDTSNRESVKALAEYASSLGEIKNVINAAGVSPAMNVTPEQILRINSLGTVYVNEEFSKLMKPGSVIVDVSSNSAYQMPGFMIPKKVYPLAITDENKFLAKMVKKTNIVKDPYIKNGMTYAFSKNFVCWYAQKSAFELGLKGIRVVSLSPGLIATPMGNLEKGSGGFLIPYSAEERMGKPEELGYALATLADERNGYLAGVDVLCDGGSTYGQKVFKKYKKAEIKAAQKAAKEKK
ncbi:MAG: SDR family NAD(P)-dependent oxidoreductase [Bacilli bacterium]|nr:SDR family NAD(P)-dependent oxidoreductase [Bacilli bacterium]